MPEIIVTESASRREAGAVLLRERVNLSDFESRHFTVQLIERLAWAVGDADEAERSHRPARRAAQDRPERAPAPSVV